ncbi:uncharacterized protein LOC142057043 [Phalacrocorax aristotelis]|uniref:uncharacterized protein LOC142057043 n=1 Tax=Phalacrocorax aristotelis TaxID=126867 RepID=UPI003F4B64D4
MCRGGAGLAVASLGGAGRRGAAGGELLAVSSRLSLLSEPWSRRWGLPVCLRHSRDIGLGHDVTSGGVKVSAAAVTALPRAARWPPALVPRLASPRLPETRRQRSPGPGPQPRGLPAPLWEAGAPSAGRGPVGRGSPSALGPAVAAPPTPCDGARLLNHHCLGRARGLECRCRCWQPVLANPTLVQPHGLYVRAPVCDVTSVSYGSTYGPEIEKERMRLQGSLNNLMTDILASPNKIKSYSVVLHMLLLQAVSLGELKQAEPASVSKQVAMTISYACGTVTFIYSKCEDHASNLTVSSGVSPGSGICGSEPDRLGCGRMTQVPPSRREMI